MDRKKSVWPILGNGSAKQPKMFIARSRRWTSGILASCWPFPSSTILPKRMMPRSMRLTISSRNSTKIQVPSTNSTSKSMSPKKYPPTRSTLTRMTANTLWILDQIARDSEPSYKKHTKVPRWPLNISITTKSSWVCPSSSQRSYQSSSWLLSSLKPGEWIQESREAQAPTSIRSC